MKRGQRILVEGFDGRRVWCRFVEQREATARVCSESEFMEAERQGREPECIGFPITSIRLESEPSVGSDKQQAALISN